MDYKYKVGQRVLIRPDLKPEKNYYMRSGPEADIVNNWAIEEMVERAGKVIQIENIADSQYRAVGWNWTDEMFAGLCDKLFVCKSLL